MEGGPDDPEQPPSFPVVTLQGSPSSREWRAKYCDLLKRFIKLLRRKPLLERLAGGETYAFTFRELNGMLDDICVGIGLDGMAGEAQWKEDWGRGCEFQADRLQQLMSDASPRVLIGAMRGERQVKTIVVDMCVWLERNPLGRLRELKKQTIENLRIYLNLETRVITSETVGSVQRARVLSIFNGIYLSATWKSWLIRARILVKYKPLLERLAKCEIVRERIFHLQLRLTEVGKEVNVAELPTWIEDWDDDCENQFSKLSQLEANSSERGLVKGLCGKKKVQEALFALKRSIGKRGQSVEMKQLKEATYARVEAYSNQAGLHLFDWFISRDEIEYNDKVIEAEGTFGYAHHGT
ncbi:hypothetical protein PC128_g7896 [Phytophthora cactorum]|nr:hypothetical protein PC128_g7896 [Phytophthora cactorum]